MKRTKSLCVLAAAAVAALFVLYSCAQDVEETMSIEGRIDKFATDINQKPRDNVYTNCHPSAAMYNQAKPAAFWDTLFGSVVGGSISFSNRIKSGTTITADVSAGNYSGQKLTFTLQEDGKANWKIIKIDRVGGTSIFN
jgi:hypothetical protein